MKYSSTSFHTSSSPLVKMWSPQRMLGNYVAVFMRELVQRTVCNRKLALFLKKLQILTNDTVCIIVYWRVMNSHLTRAWFCDSLMCHSDSKIEINSLTELTLSSERALQGRPLPFRLIYCQQSAMKCND